MINTSQNKIKEGNLEPVLRKRRAAKILRLSSLVDKKANSEILELRDKRIRLIKLSTKKLSQSAQDTIQKRIKSLAEDINSVNVWRDNWKRGEAKEGVLRSAKNYLDKSNERTRM
jgi:hypothetical protein